MEAVGPAEVGGGAGSGDVTVREEVGRLFADAEARLGRIDGLVDIVGIARQPAYGDISPGSRERDRGRRTDPRRGASDQGCASLEVTHAQSITTPPLGPSVCPT